MKIFNEDPEGRLCPECNEKGYEKELIVDTDHYKHNGVEGYIDLFICEKCGWKKNWRFRSLKEAEELNFISDDN